LDTSQHPSKFSFNRDPSVVHAFPLLYGAVRGTPSPSPVASRYPIAASTSIRHLNSTALKRLGMAYRPACRIIEGFPLNDVAARQHNLSTPILQPSPARSRARSQSSHRTRPRVTGRRPLLQLGLTRHASQIQGLGRGLVILDDDVEAQTQPFSQFIPLLCISAFAS